MKFLKALNLENISFKWDVPKLQAIKKRLLKEANFLMFILANQLLISSQLYGALKEFCFVTRNPFQIAVLVT